MQGSTELGIAETPVEPSLLRRPSQFGNEESTSSGAPIERALSNRHTPIMRSGPYSPLPAGLFAEIERARTEGAGP